mgnify:CR=1 FL=1
MTAQNGKEAWDILTAQDVQLAILDVMMPVMDGFNLLRKIRERSTIPVVFLTARTDDMDKVLGLGLGADDYLGKPFSVAELITRVGAQLRRSNEYLSPNEKSATSIIYGNLSIDKEKCCAITITERRSAMKGRNNKLTPFGKYVAKTLMDRDMTKTQLAAIIGTSPQYLSYILYGSRSGEKYLPAIIAALALDPRKAGKLIVA